MGGPANEKAFCSQLSRQSATMVWVGSNSKKASANTTAFHFGPKTRMFPGTLGKLEEGQMLGFGFMTVSYLKQPRRGLGPLCPLDYVGVRLQQLHKDKLAFSR